MRIRRLLTSVFGYVAAVLVLFPNPALARRTVIDASYVMTFVGYCSPGDAATVGCEAQSLPFAMQIGGQTFNSFYVNSNGVLSLESIEAQLAPQNSYTGEFPDINNYTGPDPLQSLSEYSVPVFSPNFVDGPGYAETFLPPIQFDGEFVATFSSTADSVAIEWYSCDSPLFCGTRTVDSLTNITGDIFLEDQLFVLGFQALGCPCDPYPGDEAIRAAGVEAFLQLLDLPVYSMLLTDLESGFQVDFTYNADALGDIGTYGFNLPTGLFEARGPLANRTFVFDANGQLVGQVPEPGTWAMMLLGFGLIGFALRRRKQAQARFA